MTENDKGQLPLPKGRSFRGVIMMKPEVEEYFASLEPLFECLVKTEGKYELDLTAVDKISVEKIVQFASFFSRPVIYKMEVLNELWRVFKGTNLNYLIDKPIYSSFRITVIKGQLDAEVVTENCGKYYMSYTLKGKAQRHYLYRLLSGFHASIKPNLHIDEDIELIFDGKTIQFSVEDENKG